MPLLQAGVLFTLKLHRGQTEVVFYGGHLTFLNMVVAYFCPLFHWWGSLAAWPHGASTIDMLWTRWAGGRGCRRAGWASRCFYPLPASTSGTLLPAHTLMPRQRAHHPNIMVGCMGVTIRRYSIATKRPKNMLPYFPAPARSSMLYNNDGSGLRAAALFGIICNDSDMRHNRWPPRVAWAYRATHITCSYAESWRDLIQAAAALGIPGSLPPTPAAPAGGGHLQF